MPTPITTFTTARLLAQAITPADFADIHRLHSDPLVMRTLSADGKPLSEEVTGESIRQTVDHWQQHGFGLWVFRRRSDGTFVGRGGLKTYQIDGKNIIGLAYAVMSDYWNQGFATEMGQASLDVGFGQLGFTEIASWTLPINVASQRVMEKLGFRYERDFEFAGLLHRFYRLVKGEWKGYDGTVTPASEQRGTLHETCNLSDPDGNSQRRGPGPD
jgi:RimJ/RimL family protein N-acetyltransferase